MMQSVQVIIERLKTNPEDFFGDADSRGRIPRFRNILDKLDDLLVDKHDAGHIHRLWFLESEEKAALIEAYKEARRARFEAQVFHDLLSPVEEQELGTVTYKATNRYHPHTGQALMQGPSGPMWNGSVPDEVDREPQWAKPQIRREGGPVLAKN